MAWTPYQYILAIVMVVAGSVNIIISKWTDKTYSVGRDGVRKPFVHPFLQALGMFFAEFTWLFAYKYIVCYYKYRNIPQQRYPITVLGSNNFNPLMFYVPAVLDMIGTSLMFIALNLTFASSFQMLRGALIIFTGLLSVALLGNNLRRYHWFGIIVITIGLLIVGVGDFLLDNTDCDIRKVITGDLIIIISQIIIALQYVYEERFIENISPFQAIGWEGFFGFVTLSVLLIPMYYIKVKNVIFNNPQGRLEDTIDAFYQLRNCWQIAVGFCGGLISLAFFNISGISVTQQLSATTRTILDSIRTFTVWLFSVIVGWQLFEPLHIIGFGVIVVGMCIYNDVLFRKLLIKVGMLNEDTGEDVEYEQSRNWRFPYGSINDSSASCSSIADSGQANPKTCMKTVDEMS